LFAGISHEAEKSLGSFTLNIGGLTNVTKTIGCFRKYENIDQKILNYVTLLCEGFHRISQCCLAPIAARLAGRGSPYCLVPSCRQNPEQEIQTALKGAKSIFFEKTAQ